MAFCPKTFNQSGSWIGTEPHTHSERVFSHLNSAEEMEMASHWRPQSEHPYKYVRATRFSSSKYWKEYQKGQATSQEQQYHGMTNLPTSAPQTLRFVGNLIHPQSTSVRGSQLASTRPVVTPVRKDISFAGTALPNMATTCPSNMNNLIPTSNGTAALLSQLGPLLFMGNLNLPAEVFHGQQNIMDLKPAQSPGIMTHGGLAAPRVDVMSSTSAAPASLSTGAFGGAPTHSQTAGVHYSREDLLKMINLHGEMMVKYRELRGKAENIEKLMMQSVCPTEHQVETESTQDRSWKEEAKGLDDLTGGFVLPEDAVEKLEAIAGILDLAREMGFLTMC